MKLILGLLVFGMISLACNNSLSSQNNNKEIVTITEISIPTAKWFYRPYTDSSINRQSIFKYSNSCASFAYEVLYDKNNPDSILFKGYNENMKLPLIRISDNIYWAGDTIQHWVLKFLDGFSRMTLKEYMDKSYANKADSKTYLFDREDKDIESLSKHFIKNILAGKYKSQNHEIILTDELIKTDEFSDYYKIIGIDSVDTYEAVINFWEMVPQMDLINLFRKDGSFYKQYNWQFENNKLILRRVKEIYKDGDFSGGVAENVDYELEKTK